MNESPAFVKFKMPEPQIPHVRIHEFTALLASNQQVPEKRANLLLTIDD